jgi:GTPase SAR1 family protein
MAEKQDKPSLEEYTLEELSQTLRELLYTLEEYEESEELRETRTQLEETRTEQEETLERLESYKRALAEGRHVDVSYGRVMLLGTAGVGKTSLKRSFMRQPFDPHINSTIVSDVSLVKHKADNNQWTEVTEKDDADELAQLLENTDTIGSRQSTAVDASSLYQLGNLSFGTEPVSTSQVKEIKDSQVKTILRGAAHDFHRSKAIHPTVNIWDCGGQPVFLEILPAFLTPRTMFLLLFDASKDFHKRWQSVITTDGQREVDEEVNETTLEMMSNWSSTIHGHLAAHEQVQPLCQYPRLYYVGTHGDKLSAGDKERVKMELEEHYRGKSYSEIVEDTVIIDNTTSGTDNEDVNICNLRNAIGKFTSEKLTVKTPISWVVFLHTLYKENEKKMVVNFAKACEIGVACEIPSTDVPSALLFYHEVGTLLFYPFIDGLRDKVIIDPKWFADTLGKVFMPAGRGDPYARDLLIRKGILVEQFYRSVWNDIKELVDPEAIMDLLVHFRLAAQIHVKEHYRKDEKQYFLPAVLKLSEDIVAPSTIHQTHAVPSHITFSTDYVPPGFFTRLIATLSSKPSCEVNFDNEVYRNRVTFSYKGHNHLILTNLERIIQVELFRLESNAYGRLRDVSHQLIELLDDCSSEVENTLSSCHSGIVTAKVMPIQRKFQYVCQQCPNVGLHYLVTSPYEASICCTNNRHLRPPTEEELVWLHDNTSASPTCSTSSQQMTSQSK